MISVIIPVYNAEKYFEKCLRSLFNQTLDQIEYLFIDDCTPDRSFDILSIVLGDYPQRKNQVRIIHNSENLGSGASRNVGLRAASGDYVIHCDSDDWCDINLYQAMYSTAIARDADIVCCAIAHEFSTHSYNQKFSYKEELKDSLQSLNFDLLYSSVCNKLVKRSFYEKHEVFFFEGVNMWEDLGYMSRLRYYSSQTLVIEDLYYHYNKFNEGSIVSVPSLLKVEEQVKCAVLLDAFFSTKGKEYALIGPYLKFVAKASFLHVPALRDCNKWKTMFKETHPFIWRYSTLPLNMRLFFWIASLGFLWTSCFLFDLKDKLYQNLR